MKTAVWLMLVALWFRGCELLQSPGPSDGPVRITMTLTDTTGAPQREFHVDEPFMLMAITTNTGSAHQDYQRTGPTGFFEIRSGDSIVSTSIDGQAWIQVVREEQLPGGASDTIAWLGPQPRSSLWKRIVLDPGTYTARYVPHRQFTSVHPELPGDIPFTVRSRPVHRWVHDLILRFRADSVGNPPQSIWRFSFEGADVYYVPPQCCDQFSVLYDAHGTIMGAPDGGFGGGGDGRVPEFFARATNRELIWQDTRSRK
jgi:hypothetical protein